MARMDEDAPWLAEAPPLEPARPQRPWVNILIAALVLAAVVALALLLFTGRRDDGSTQGYMEAAQAPLIEADPGPWKVPPADRQGLEVDGAGEVIHEAVRGDAVQSRIDMAALPEEPIGRPRDLLPPGSVAPAPASPAQTSPAPPAATLPPAAPAPTATLPTTARPQPTRPVPAAQPAAAPMPAPARPAAVAAKTAPTPAPTPQAAAPAGAGMVQIGAFSSAAKADEEWARVAARAGLSGKRVEPSTNAAGKTLYRLRGRAADTAAACRAVRAAGGACDVVKG
jgi:hypothetical protein